MQGHERKLAESGGVADRQLLERQILEIGDREQARIGQDIHDGLCQQLVSTAFDAHALRQILEEQHSQHAIMAARMAESLDAAVTEARRLASGLFPVRLETDGLPPALEELASSISDRFHVRCTFSPQPLPEVLNVTVATHLYRIAQEAGTNAAKHGQAKNIRIDLLQKPEGVELSVLDDGIGLPTVKPENAAGMGLHIMAYRARSLGGTLRLGRRPGGGTALTCLVPIDH